MNAAVWYVGETRWRGLWPACAAAVGKGVCTDALSCWQMALLIKDATAQNCFHHSIM